MFKNKNKYDLFVTPEGREEFKSNSEPIGAAELFEAISLYSKPCLFGGTSELRITVADKDSSASASTDTPVVNRYKDLYEQNPSVHRRYKAYFGYLHTTVSQIYCEADVPDAEQKPFYKYAVEGFPDAYHMIRILLEVMKQFNELRCNERISDANLCNQFNMDAIEVLDMLICDVKDGAIK